MSSVPILIKILKVNYQANNPTNAAVSKDTKIPANNIIGTYLETKSDVFFINNTFQCTYNHSNS